MKFRKTVTIWSWIDKFSVLLESKFTQKSCLKRLEYFLWYCHKFELINLQIKYYNSTFSTFIQFNILMLIEYQFLNQIRIAKKKFFLRNKQKKKSRDSRFIPTRYSTRFNIDLSRIRFLLDLEALLLGSLKKKVTPPLNPFLGIRNIFFVFFISWRNFLRYLK